MGGCVVRKVRLFGFGNFRVQIVTSGLSQKTLTNFLVPIPTSGSPICADFGQVLRQPDAYYGRQLQ